MFLWLDNMILSQCICDRTFREHVLLEAGLTGQDREQKHHM